MSNTPLLEGYGVRLVPLSIEHLPALTQIALDESIWRYMSVRPTTPEDVKKHMEDALLQAEQGVVEAWVTFVGDEAVGATRFLDIQRTHRAAEIGFTWLAKPWRSSGVNPRVKLLQMAYGFETLGLRRIALKTHHENLHSQNAMLKLGAQYEGTFRNHLIMPDGTTRHTKWYSIIVEDWPGVKARLLERIAGEPIHRRA
jgi:RimJ/RimL family protein N-acetyltransferase